jgi:GNAT superfamily N-acetyltransferase
MAQYVLEEVVTSQQKKEFIDLPKKLYKGNRYWVCPLDGDIEARFDPAKNELFVGGEAIRWIVRDAATGKVVGRIGAWYNKEQAALEEQPTGGCGFFEAINDQDVANMLFDASRDWLKSKGMEAMDGPVNFGDRDQWWGLLVDGYELQPLYANPYNPPYYKELFENYGFQNYFNQYSYYRTIATGGFNPSVYERVKRLNETPGYSFQHISKKNMVQVADDFRRIYNKAWARHSGVKPIDREHAMKLMNSMKPIIDEKLIYFARFNDEPIGFFIMVPDINRVIGRFMGKMNLINKLRLVWLLRQRKADRIFAMIFAVDPDFHGKGIEAGIMHCFEETLLKEELPYKTLELAWVGDFNPVMMRMVESYVCASRHKVHVTYRYLFDREKEFKRCPRISVKRNTAVTN